MAIKVSSLLISNTVLLQDPSPTLGADLNTNNFSIDNGINPVTISGNQYPANSGTVNQVLTTNGVGVLSWGNPTALKLYTENYLTPTPPVALAINSIALGDGAQTSVNATDSLAIGLQSLARIQGGVVQASGRFSSTGDAQTGRYLLRSNTINAVPAELFIDGTMGAIRLELPDDCTWVFKITITGHRTDVQDGHAGYIAEGVIYRGAGVSSTNMQGRFNKTVLAESNPSWDINILADTTYGSLKITVTGETGKTIRWLALVETVEVTN